MNNENLRPASIQSKEEARANGSKGGKRSGEARRQKKALKEIMLQYAEMTPTEKEKMQLQAMGFNVKEITNLTAYAVSLFKNGAKGNSKALELSFDLLTNNQKKELEIKKLQAELDRLKLENEKLRKDIDKGETESNSNFDKYMEFILSGQAVKKD